MRRKLGCLVAVVTVLASYVLLVPAPDYPPAPLLVINEVAWAGNSESHTAEWIELFNPSSRSIDLQNWRLLSSDGAPDIMLQGAISGMTSDNPESGFFLLERGSDTSVPDQIADQLYQGALNNSGETLMLIDPYGRVVDTANAPTDGMQVSGWAAGSATTFSSMERVNYTLPDTPPNWAHALLPEDLATQTPPLVLGTPARRNWAHNLPPVVAFTITPAIPHPGTLAAFSAMGTSDPNHDAIAYSWSFGDGATAEGANVTHVYETGGTYTVSLTVRDAKGGVSQLDRELLVRVTSLPVADFSVLAAPDETVVRAKTVLTFLDESSDADGDIETWDWDFGDGKTASGISVNHSYRKAGQYEVTLRVVDDQGESNSLAHVVTVASQRPVLELAMLTAQPQSAAPTEFDASRSFDPDGRIAHYQWDFDGDGTLDLDSEQATASYTYAAGGEYTLRLIGVDDQNEQTVLERTVLVNSAPIVQFQLSSFAPKELEAIALNDRSVDLDGHIVRWSWHFGDGVLSANPAPRHIYQQSGEMTVTLTVTDDQGAKNSATALVTVENLPPRAILAPAPLGLVTDMSHPFDASHSIDASTNGEIVKYEWDVDGTGNFAHETTVPTYSHSYPDNGHYDVRVRVTDDDGAQHVSLPINVRVVNRPPEATRIWWSPTNPVDGEEVTFNSEGRDQDGEVQGWSWVLELKDSGTAGSSQTFKHVFQDSGNYTISLQVRDDDGASSVPLLAQIEIGNAPPIASFSVVHDSTCEPGSIRFDARGSKDLSPQGKIVHVAWDFGDGTSCPGNASDCLPDSHWTPTHCYSEPGTYIVTLVVIDDHGSIASATRTIQIAE